MTANSPTKRGWFLASNQRERHYFTNPVSICDQIILLIWLDAELVDADDDLPNNCAKCRKRVKKQRKDGK